MKDFDLFEWWSEPILNHLFQMDRKDPLFEILSNQLQEMHRASGKNGGAVKFLKSKLGKQKFCCQLSSKNWVWEGDRWRAFASKEGLSFEVVLDLSLKEAINAWEDFRKKIGLS